MDRGVQWGCYGTPCTLLSSQLIHFKLDLSKWRGGQVRKRRVSQAPFGLFRLALTRRRVLELGDLSSGHNLGQVKANLRDSAKEQTVLVTSANCLEKNEQLE